MTGGRGFTLLEMLLATALSALLVIGVMGVITNITRANYATAGEAAAAHTGADPLNRDPGASAAAWSEMLAEEVAHCVAVELDGDRGLAMITYAALDGGGRERAYRPVVVRYTVAEVGDTPWLVRQQGSLDGGDARTAQRDLVCANVERVALMPSNPLPEPQTPEHEARLVQLGRSADSPVYFRGLTLRRIKVDPDEAEDAEDNGARQRDVTRANRLGGDRGAAQDASSPLYAYTSGADTEGWRLRVWLAGEDRPTIDRELTLR